MAKAYKVISSVNLPGDTVCVDVFEREDGTFGFEEYRRDPEDGQGWFVIGHHGHHSFNSFEAAEEAAKSTVAWIRKRRPSFLELNFRKLAKPDVNFRWRLPRVFAQISANAVTFKGACSVVMVFVAQIR
mgnify:CR=1 FL=1